MQDEMQKQAFIQADNLSVKTVQGAVFEDVSFTAYLGQVVALFGADGCGKTSLLLTLGGRMKPTSGDALVNGHSLAREYKKTRDISGISLIKNVNDIPEYLTVYDNVAAEMALHSCKSNKATVMSYLDEWNFKGCARKRLDELNPNEKMEFDLMLTCVNKPKLILLDGVGAGMTYRRTAKMVEHLGIMARERNLCVLFSTHEYDIAKVADSVVVLSQAAEEQRLRVVRDQGKTAYCNVAGSGNKVVCREFLEAPAHERKFAGKRCADGHIRLGDLFSEDALSAEFSEEAAHIETTETTKEIETEAETETEENKEKEEVPSTSENKEVQ